MFGLDAFFYDTLISKKIGNKMLFFKLYAKCVEGHKRVKGYYICFKLV